MCCCIRTIMEASHKPRQGDCPRTGASSPSTTSSETSQRSKSTAPTIYSDHRPTSKRNEPVVVNDNHNHNYNQSDEDAVVGPRDSVSTYASTVPSVDEITEEEEEEELGPRYEVFDRRLEFFPTDALPSNPHTFGDLFPSSRRLRIRHDDATLDGNMNLRVDTVVPHRAGHQQDVTLFHLRMYDLFSRRFSFRRYCRDSGREVFHSERKHSSSSQKKLSRSWSSALASLRPGYSSGQPMRRRDSGPRPTGNDEGVFLDDEDLDSSQDNNDRHPVGFTDTTMLEFSNYAHVEVNRRGAGIPKRYDYEYWSTRYQWRRECRREGDLREVSYHLFSTQSSKPIAHLVPDILTPVEAVEEEDKGGWIPPSSMWISDPSVYEKMPDVAE